MKDAQDKKGVTDMTTSDSTGPSDFIREKLREVTVPKLVKPASGFNI